MAIALRGSRAMGMPEEFHVNVGRVMQYGTALSIPMFFGSKGMGIPIPTTFRTMKSTTQL
ncbi:hypothetical protein N7481_002152 [Penicillium waksmanii]|uniref:uncharacterized protein n=1 Tax=Penicillium waksmanii TaxID=69791 RepID=UPI002548B41C|nr:uncharacterized protein N7481_002152 [Penicillium waksmanii]KAJ5995175.1 hypothetical protein N7481_002152 [Penicillium waksmanii]